MKKQNKEDFMQIGREFNDELSFDSGVTGEGVLEFDEYMSRFSEEDQKAHKDWIEELYSDYLELMEG